MYTEDDQYGVKPENNNSLDNDKKFKKFIILVSAAIVALIILIIIIYLLLSKKSGLNIPTYKLSKTEWTNEVITLTVDDQKGKVVEYSFDGGKTWQKENAIEVSENGTYNIVVKNSKGKKSKAATAIIENIDKSGPIISFTDPLYVQKGGTFDYKSGVSIEDNGSGLKEYVMNPQNIDTSNDQELKVIYRAYDNLGNVTEKERTIIVKNLIIKTYYRSRSIVQEKYNCDPYQCKCTSCSNAKQTATVTCPSGYTVSGTKCKTTDTKPVSTVCSSGYYLDGNICRQYKDFQIRNNCTNGFTVSEDGMKCEINTVATKKTVTFPANGCPSGWTKQGSECVIKTTNIQLIYDCGGTGGVLDTSKKACKFEKINMCNNPEYPKQVGTKCYDASGIYSIDINKVCPEGTEADGSYCYKKANISCPIGSTYNSKTGTCEYISNSSPITNKKHDVTYYTCSNNKTLVSGNRCISYYTLQNEKYCTSGYRSDGTKCISNNTKDSFIGCESGYTKSGNMCTKQISIDGNISCPRGYALATGTTCKSTATSGTCCQTCYKSCTRDSYGEWSEWTLNVIKPSSKLQVETKVE